MPDNRPLTLPRFARILPSARRDDHELPSGASLVRHWGAARPEGCRYTPHLAPVRLVEGVQIGIPAADEDEASLGHHGPSGTRGPKSLGKLDSFQQWMIAYRRTSLTEWHFPDNISLVEIDGNEQGIGRLDDRNRA